MIGDFGITLYFGTNSDIQSVLKQTLDIDIALYEKLRVGMSYSAIYEQCAALLKEAGSYNAIASLNDPAGTNIGHTIPAADSDWSEAERRVFSSGDWPAICSLIGKKRLFINELEHTPIAATGAFTIEPRPLVNNRPDLPMVSLHTMVLWRKGQKQLVTFFERLFRLAGMDYMFDAVTSPVLATSSRFSQRLI
jgi:Xaa-Pro aminopeptidase